MESLEVVMKLIWPNYINHATTFLRHTFVQTVSALALLGIMASVPSVASAQWEHPTPSRSQYVSADTSASRTFHETPDPYFSADNVTRVAMVPAASKKTVDPLLRDLKPLRSNFEDAWNSGLRKPEGNSAAPDLAARPESTFPETQPLRPVDSLDAPMGQAGSIIREQMPTFEDEGLDIAAADDGNFQMVRSNSNPNNLRHTNNTLGQLRPVPESDDFDPAVAPRINPDANKLPPQLLATTQIPDEPVRQTLTPMHSPTLTVPGVGVTDAQNDFDPNAFSAGKLAAPKALPDQQFVSASADSPNGYRTAEAPIARPATPRPSPPATPVDDFGPAPAFPPQQQEPAAPTVETFAPGRVIAKVGGHPIFVGDMMFEVNQLIEKFMQGAPQALKEKQKPQLIKRLIPKYVDAKVLYVSMVRNLPEQADVEAILKSAEDEFNEKALGPMIEDAGLSSPLHFDAHLRAMGSSLRQLRRSWSEDQLTKFFLAKQLQIDSEVTHQEMLDYYREQQEEFSFKGKARWEQLMVRFDKAGGLDNAKRLIVDMGNKVAYGANLAEVAKGMSHGFNASSGGRHDWLTRGSLVWEEVDNAIFELPVGQLSKVIESKDGYHIIRVLERTENGHTPFLEAQVEIKKKLLDKKRADAFQEHVAKLRDRIPVEVYEYDPELSSAKAHTLSSPTTR